MLRYKYIASLVRKYIKVYILWNNHNLLTALTHILCLLATRNGIRRGKVGLLNYGNSRLQVQNYL